MSSSSSSSTSSTSTITFPEPVLCRDGKYLIVLFYKYVDIPEGELDFFAQWVTDKCNEYSLSGRVLVATEGINGNLAGEGKSGVEAFCNDLQGLSTFKKSGAIDFKLDTSHMRPFPDLKVQRKKEICSTGNIVPKSLLDKGFGGKHLTPDEFHSVLEDYWGNSTVSDGKDKKELVVLDVRNNIEYGTGHFQGRGDGQVAENPGTKTFSQWTSKIDKKTKELSSKKVLMYCTGGIRCEKASAYLKSKGVEDVSQLSGGIHRYLERFGSSGYFQGSNFVFDARALQTPAEAMVVGRCFSCNDPTDQVSCDRCCAVCRAAVLVCDPCRVKCFGVYYCPDHLDLKGVYEPFLGRFSVEQLQSQKTWLQELRIKFQGQTRVKSLHNHIIRIDGCIKMKTGQTPAMKKMSAKWTSNPRCRSCGMIGPADLLSLLGRTFGDSSLVCDGKCAGCGTSSYTNPKRSLDVMNLPGFGEEGRVGRKKRNKSRKDQDFSKRIRLATEKEYSTVKYDVVKSSDGLVLRCVEPYPYEFLTHTKERWANLGVLDMFAREFSKNRLYYERAIEWGLITVNDKLAQLDTPLRGGDLISNLTHRHEPPVLYVNGKDIVIQETEEMVIVDKPASVTVHPSGSYRKNSLLFILAAECNLRDLYPVHRLDRLTSGLVLFGKNASVANEISQAMKRKTYDHSTTCGELHKAYLARVVGRFPSNETEAGPVSRHVSADVRVYWETSSTEPMLDLRLDTDGGSGGNLVVSWPIRILSVKHGTYETVKPDLVNSCADGKACLSRIKFLGYDPVSNTSLVQCEPITGRTHQLRLHLSFLGFPIVNDPNYGEDGNVARKAIQDARDKAQEKCPPNIPDSKPPNMSREELSKILCVSCNEGMDVAFKEVQLRYQGLDLHAFRYKLNVRESKYCFDYQTAVPAFARTFLRVKV